MMAILGVCPSGKVAYADELDALLTLEHLARTRDGLDKNERNLYGCSSCGFFHLTSGPVWQ